VTEALIVINPGLHTTVQDLGRIGYQALGVPVAGALDPVALRLANSLVGNPQRTAVFEFLYAGPTFEVAAASVRVAIAHANTEIMGTSKSTVPAWQSFRVDRGDTLRIGAPAGSSCGYMAIEGGLDLPPVLGSLSTYSRSAIGGFNGRALAAGDRIPLVHDTAEARTELKLSAPPSITAPESLRVVLGPQEDHFTPGALEAFLSEKFRVSKHADRMGLRLEGPRLTHRDGYNIVSDGIVTGAIQVPGSGQSIVLLADHQSTGGYPKIATVISADLPAAGRLMPGNPIRFAAVSVQEAEDAARQLEKNIERCAADLVPATTRRSLSGESLYGDNLISGVVNAMD
jgi:biotin-dependent carboxylase-like uncharacterized protein